MSYEYINDIVTYFDIGKNELQKTAAELANILLNDKYEKLTGIKRKFKTLKYNNVSSIDLNNLKVFISFTNNIYTSTNNAYVMTR